MAKKITFLLFLFFSILFFSANNLEERRPNQNIKSEARNRDLTARTAASISDFVNIPLYFIHNKGQVNPRVKFYAKTPRYILWITKSGLVFDRQQAVNRESKTQETKPCDSSDYSLHRPNLKYNRDISRLVFINSEKNPEIIPVQQTAAKINYFKGTDKTKWHCNVPTYGAILYKNLYPGIDLKIYGIENQIEYDWVINPGKNPEEIQFEYDHVRYTRIDSWGNLIIRTEFGEFTHKKPVGYQKLPEHSSVNVSFKKINKNRYGFEIDHYDPRFPLVIDPVILVYSTYLGGSRGDYAHGLDIDSNGHVYVTGYTFSTDFPVLNHFQSDPGDDAFDVFVTRLDPGQSGISSILYSSYLGGSDVDWGHAIVVGDNGNVFVTGQTASADFPNSYPPVPLQGPIDAFVAWINTSQSGASSFIYSVYLGGSGDDSAYDITMDDDRNVYICGSTNSMDFPVQNQYQTFQGGYDIFVSKIRTTGMIALLYSTYLGGNGDDHAYGVAANNTGHVYLSGETQSPNFPVLREYQGDQGGSDAFVSRLDTNQSGPPCLVYSTYLGGGNDDRGRRIAIDSSSHAYITGDTISTDFPTIYPYQNHQGEEDVFVTRIDTTLSGSSALIYSTYFGGVEADLGHGIATDDNGIVYVSGNTSSPDFPILHHVQTNKWARDVFAFSLDTNQTGAAALIYSTYLGGNGREWSQSIKVDSSGYAYVAGRTNSSDFPLTNEIHTFMGVNDAFVSKLSPILQTYSIFAWVSAGKGTVNPKSQHVFPGETALVKIFPHSGYEIQSIIDNGFPVPIVNPYKIPNVQSDHEIEVVFAPDSFPPILQLTAERKTEKAWIIRREYAEITINITEHPSKAMPVSKIILYSFRENAWMQIAEFHSVETHVYLDSTVEKGQSYRYKAAALNSEGKVVSESNMAEI